MKVIAMNFDNIRRKLNEIIQHHDSCNLVHGLKCDCYAQDVLNEIMNVVIKEVSNELQKNDGKMS